MTTSPGLLLSVEEAAAVTVTTLADEDDELETLVMKVVPEVLTVVLVWREVLVEVEAGAAEETALVEVGAGAAEDAALVLVTTTTVVAATAEDEATLGTAAPPLLQR